MRGACVVIGTLLLTWGAPLAAAPEHPLIAALHAMRQDPTGRTLEVIAKSASKPDAAAIDRVASALRDKKQPEAIAASSELLHRWLKVASTVEERVEAIAILQSLAGWAEKAGQPRPAWHDEAITLAQQLAKKFPDQITAHQLLGDLLAAPPTRALPAMEAYARCLELSGQSGRCRKEFGEVSRWYVTPQCEGKELRPLQLRALSPKQADVSLPESAIVAVGAGSVFPHGSCRGAAVKVRTAPYDRLRAAVAKSGAPIDLAVVVEDKERARVRVEPGTGVELICVPVPVEEICRHTVRPALPAHIARWLPGADKE